MPSEKFEHARHLIDRGFYIFPIKENDKHPPLVEWAEASTCDPGQVEIWWTRWPEANIGIDCGKSGLAVVDVDTKPGKVGQATLDWLAVDDGLELPETLTAQTPSGGFHYIYRGECQTSVGTKRAGIGPDVDTRGVGGYIVAVGSVIGGVEYRWLGVDREPEPVPAWIVERAAFRKRDANTETPDVDLDEPDAIARATDYAKRVEPAIEGSGGDNHTFKVAAQLRDFGISEHVCFQILLEHFNPRCAPPWDHDDLERKVQNAYEYSANKPGSKSARADFQDDEVDESSIPPSAGHNGPPGEDDDGLRGAPLGALRRDWVYVGKGNTFVRREDKFQYTKNEFDGRFGFLAERGLISTEIRNESGRARAHMRKFDSFCYRPNDDEECDGGRLYNLWRGSGIKPVPGGAPEFMAHMAWLFPHEDERMHVMRWLAAAVRGHKLNHALLIHGRIEGTGKSLIGKYLARILGEHNVAKPPNTEINSRFQSWAANVQLCWVEEAMAAGRVDFMNTLKDRITSDTQRVELKNKDAYETDNFVNFLLFSNHSNALFLEDTDRRYIVIHVAHEAAHPDGDAYYTPLFNGLKSPDYVGRVLQELLNVDISDYHVKGRAPWTAAHADMERASYNDVQGWLKDHLDEIGELVNVDDLVTLLPAYMARAKGIRMTVEQFVKGPQRGIDVGRVRVRDGRRQLYAIGPRRYWLQKRSHKYLAEMYARQGKSGEFEDATPDPLA